MFGFGIFELFDTGYTRMPPGLQQDWVNHMSGASISAFAFCAIVVFGGSKFRHTVEQYVNADGRVALNRSIPP